MQQLHLIYDYRQSHPIPGFAYFFLLFAPIGLGVLIYNLLHNSEKKILGIIIGAFFTLFSFSLFLAVAGSRMGADSVASQYFTKGNYKMVQGTITNYHPAPPEGHRPETFDVDTVHFEIWDADLSTPGYSATAVSGSVIHAGLYVKIAYAKIYEDNAILRLETGE